MKTTKEMKAAIEKMLKLYEESERLEEIDEAAAADRAYEQAHALCMEITETIVKVTRGMIDKATARVMVLKTPEKLIAICEKF
jgi:hypothetical protein